MNRAIRFGRLLRQFPWLKEIADPELEISVKRFSKEMLLCVPKDESWNGSAGSNAIYFRFYLVVEGKVKEFKVEGEGEHGSNYAGSTPYKTEGETVLNALVRQDLIVAAKRADAICFFYHFHSDWEGREEQFEENLTIYLPKVDIASVLAGVEAEEQARLDAELARVKE